MTNEATIATELTTLDWKLPSSRKVAIICLILTETCVFSIFVAAYVFYISKSLSGPLPRDVLELPVLSTICLLSSSITITLAGRSWDRHRPDRFRVFWWATIALALFFIASTALEWRTLIYQKGLTISTNLFGTTFYSLVGLHASHVIIGLILLVLIFVFSVRGLLTSAHREHVEMISWYWHFVDAVWVVVFAVVYVIGR